MILASNGFKVLVFEGADSSISAGEVAMGAVNFKGWSFEILSFAGQDGKSSTIISHPAHVANVGDTSEPYSINLRRDSLLWYKDVDPSSSLYSQIHSTYINSKKPVVEEVNPVKSPAKSSLDKLKEILAGLSPEEIAELKK